METAIKWFYDRLHTSFYSMTQRNGQVVNGKAGFDCSSAVYYALLAAGKLPAGSWIGNTDSLYGDLERNGWQRLPVQANGFIDAQRGDVFLWGKRGASGGAFGHTGIFINANDIIHCAYGYNGIHVDNHDWLWGVNGSPEITIYRYVGAPVPAPSPDNSDQVLDIGSFIRFDGIYTADDVKMIDGIWQVRSNALCRDGFTWSDNGIPAEPLFEVDSEGYRTLDQELDVGSRFKVSGKYKVLDLGQYNGRWIAMIAWNGLNFWVDVDPVTEIKSNENGTGQPPLRPLPPVITPPAPEPPKPEEPQPAPVEPLPQPPLPEEPTTPEPPAPEEPKAPEPEAPTPTQPTVPEAPKPAPKEDDMAFTKADQKKLAIASEDAKEFADRVQASQGVQDMVKGISTRTKLTVYIIGDSLIGLGILAPQAAIVFGWGDVVRIVALSGMFTAAGGFLLTMFGIYKDGK